MTPNEFTGDVCPLFGHIYWGDADKPPIEEIGLINSKEGPNAVRQKLGKIAETGILSDLDPDEAERWRQLGRISDIESPTERTYHYWGSGKGSS